MKGEEVSHTIDKFTAFCGKYESTYTSHYFLHSPQGPRRFFLQTGVLRYFQDINISFTLKLFPISQFLQFEVFLPLLILQDNQAYHLTLLLLSRFGKRLNAKGLSSKIFLSARNLSVTLLRLLLKMMRASN